MEYKKYISKFVDFSIFRNSFYLILTSITNAGAGFLFWFVAARLYSEQSVGIASAIISSLSLLVLITRLGLNESIIRYFPNGNENNILSTTVILTTIGTIITGSCFIVLSSYSNNKYSLLNLLGVIFMLFLISDSFEGVAGKCFMALRRTDYYFAQNLVLVSRIVFLPIFLFVGGYSGIFLSVGASFFISNIVSIIGLKRLGLSWSSFSHEFIKRSMSYSGYNYVINILQNGPKHIVPIIVVAVVDPKIAAYYFIAHRISSFVFTIPTSFSLSAFIEGSHGKDMLNLSAKTAAYVVSILLFVIICVIVFGEFVLSLVGENYKNGYPLLIVLSISGIFVTFFKIYMSLERVRMNLRPVLILSLWLLISLTMGSYFLLLEMGIVGVGYAWMIGYGVATGGILTYLYFADNELGSRVNS